jgi:hypothetical protein
MGKNFIEPISLKSPINSVHLQALLDALEYQGSTYDCGPYAAASIINGLLGEKLDPAKLAKEMSKPTWKGLFFLVRRIPNWATFPWGMVDIFRRHSLDAHWKILASQGEIIQILNSGGIVLPILGQWKPLEAHIMSLVAWDPDKGWGFANTQYDHHSITWLEHTQFMHNWKSFIKPIIVVYYKGEKTSSPKEA